jgi:hypothetical protein
MEKSIRLSQILIEKGLQVRAELNQEAINDYGEALSAVKNTIPAVIVFEIEPGKFLLADGFHRMAAAREKGFKDILAEVHKGSREDALKCALGANTAHGLRLTSADKRRKVELALKEWPESSDTDLGKMCGVDHKTVASVRKEVQPANVAGSPRKGSDGVMRKLPPPKAKALGKSLVKTPSPSGLPPKAARADSPAPAPEGRKDSVGVVIPAAILPLWERAGEVEELLTYITAIRKRLPKDDKDKDLIFTRVNISTVRAGLDAAYLDIQRAIPYSVCTTCQGVDPEGCTECEGRGFICKMFWDRCVPEEKKAMRIAGTKGDKTE